MMDHWKGYAPRSSLYAPPLRPAASTVGEVSRLIGPVQGTVLLLGVTPELAAAFPKVLAVDKNPAMIASVWPGDGDGRRALCADWFDYSAPHGSFDGVVGDGSFNNIASLTRIADLLDKAGAWLKPGGRLACRVFERPDCRFTEDDLLAAPRAGAAINFHALKWMMAMHIAETHGAVVPVSAILGLFNAMFPDRAELAEASGWSPEVIATIDVYAGSTLSYCFPNRAELMATIPEGIEDLRFGASGDYPLAERCPILSFRKPRSTHRED